MYTVRDCEKSWLLHLSLNISELGTPAPWKRKTQKYLHTLILDLQEYGVTKKRVIITEMSKEVENNNIVRLNVYEKQYVSRRNVTVGGSYGGGSSGRSWILTLHVYVHSFVLKYKRKGKQSSFVYLTTYRRYWCERPIISILSWGRSDWGTRQTRFFWTYTSWLSFLRTTNPMSLWQVLRVLSYLGLWRAQKSSEFLFAVSVPVTRNKTFLKSFFLFFKWQDSTLTSRADNYPQRDWVDEANRLIAMGSTDGSVGVRSMSFFGEVARVMISCACDWISEYAPCLYFYIPRSRRSIMVLV
jgi:hypothetical protein